METLAAFTWLAAVVLMLLAVVLRAIALEWHHFMIGLGLVVLASLLSLSPFGGASASLVFIGSVIVLDDAVQHLVQLRFPSFRSPLHMLYAQAYRRSSLIRAVNRWLDGLFR